MLFDLRKYEGPLVILVDLEEKEGKQSPICADVARVEPENSDKVLPIDSKDSTTPTKEAA